MTPKKKSAAKPRSPAKTAGEHPTGPNVETFEPSHGPNVDDRSDLISPRSVSPERVPLAKSRASTGGDQGKEAETAGKTGNAGKTGGTE